MAMTPITDWVRSQPRCGVVLSRAAAAAACTLLAVACGSTAAPATSSAGSGSAGPNSAGSSSAGSASAAPAAKISLNVSFGPSATAPARHLTLQCEPAGGTTPDAAAACAKLLTGASLFAPGSRHVMCPMILASAGRATVTGTYLGKKVHLSIVNGGCDLARWTKLKQVFR